MTVPSGYSGYLPIIQRVFSSGVAPFVHATGFDAYRVITDVTGVEPYEIDPFRLRHDPSRMQHYGDPRLFTTDQREAALVETLGHTGDGAIPSGTFELQYFVTGQTLNHSLIEDQEYRDLCFRKDDHSFSQAVSFYLHSKGLNTQFDTHSWLTVPGKHHGISGYVHAWQPFNPTVITHRKTRPL